MANDLALFKERTEHLVLALGVLKSFSMQVQIFRCRGAGRAFTEKYLKPLVGFIKRNADVSEFSDNELMECIKKDFRTFVRGVHDGEVDEGYYEWICNLDEGIREELKSFAWQCVSGTRRTYVEPELKEKFENDFCFNSGMRSIVLECKEDF